LRYSKVRVHENGTYYPYGEPTFSKNEQLILYPNQWAEIHLGNNEWARMVHIKK
jgi:hypothetical protein